MPAQPLVEEIDNRPDTRRAAYPLVGEEPQDPFVVTARRQALHKVRIGIGDDARQDGNAET